MRRNLSSLPGSDFPGGAVSTHGLNHSPVPATASTSGSTPSPAPAASPSATTSSRAWVPSLVPLDGTIDAWVASLGQEVIDGAESGKAKSDVEDPPAGDGRPPKESYEQAVQKMKDARWSIFGPVYSLTDSLGLTGMPNAESSKPLMKLSGEYLDDLAASAPQDLEVEVVDFKSEKARKDVKDTLEAWEKYAKEHEEKPGMKAYLHQIEKMRVPHSEWEMTVAKRKDGTIVGFSRSDYDPDQATVWKHGTVGNPMLQRAGGAKALMSHSAKKAQEFAQALTKKAKESGDPSAVPSPSVKLNAGNQTALKIWYGMGFRFP